MKKGREDKKVEEEIVDFLRKLLNAIYICRFLEHRMLLSPLRLVFPPARPGAGVLARQRSSQRRDDSLSSRIWYEKLQNYSIDKAIKNLVLQMNIKTMRF